MDNYIYVFKKAIESWNEVIAIISKIFAVLLYYKANIIPFDPQNFGDFVPPYYR